MKGYASLTLGMFFVLIATTSSAWNEEQTDSLGAVVTFHSVKDFHSTFHYDLTLLLAVKMGFSPDTAELMARYCALVDQINPKPGYPYPLALNNISIPDTFLSWDQSLAGTERGNVFATNIFDEWAPQYWHFPVKSYTDSISGAMVYGNYPQVNNPDYRNSPYYWRVPNLQSLQNIMSWAIYGTGQAGNPNEAPVDVMYWEVSDQSYKPVEPGSLQALAIYLHVLGDAYSHEHCMVFDTLRSHPPAHDYCGLNYHSHYEFAYDEPIVAEPHAEKAAQAVWRALREFKRTLGLKTPVFWQDDNNGFEDGDGIPDELEDDFDGDYTETFMEKWKSPAYEDLNGDGKINNYDHTTWRILTCNNEYCDVAVYTADSVFVFEGELAQLNSQISYCDSLVWISCGDGTFLDPHNKNTVYQHGPQDAAAGEVKIYLHLINYRGCTEIQVFEVNLMIIKTHTIFLPSGWSGFSASFQPVETGISQLFAPIADKLLMIKDQDQFYQPGNPQSSLLLWDSSNGYFLKLSEPAGLDMAGYNLPGDSLDIVEGWNLIPVATPCPQAAGMLFLNNNKILFVKEAVGTRIYWPSASVFTLDSLMPGNAYLLKSDSDFKLGFLPCTK